MNRVASVLRCILPMDAKRRRILENHGWYRNMAGGWVHPHCLDWMSSFQIKHLTIPQLEHKLRFGSLSEPPKDL